MQKTLLSSSFLMAALIVPAGAGDIERGEALAERWCVSCHVIGSNTQGADAAPSFAMIARRDREIPSDIRKAIALPHPKMPDMNLAAPEYEDLSAYIASLAAD